MATLSIQLKQHTPIIHFQHYQDGATLRASELKPKLDKFLIKRFKDGNIDYNKWLIGNEKKEALNYKVKIVTNDTTDKYLITSYLKAGYRSLLDNNGIKYLHSMPYFAQENEISSLFEKYDSGRIDNNGRKIDAYKFSRDNLKNITKWGLMNTKGIHLIINSFDNDIINKIAESISSFFTSENFGTRQSKGFGCFSVIDSKPEKNIEMLLKENYKYVYRHSAPGKDLQDKLEQIAKDYKLLKAGRGSKEHGGYAKSQLFLYYLGCANPIRWEKRKMKRDINNLPFKDKQRDNSFHDIKLKVENGNSAIYDGNGNQSWDDPRDGFDYKYIRAVLGLAEQFEFQTDSSRYKYVVQLESKNGIERFRSPIQFKVNDDQIYLAANDINDFIFSKAGNNKTFNFKLRLKINNGLSDKDIFKRNMFDIETPENFDVGKFLEFALVTGDEKINNYKRL